MTTTYPYYDITGMVYSAHQRAFFVRHFTCDPTPVPDDAIMRFDFDYEQ